MKLNVMASALAALSFTLTARAELPAKTASPYLGAIAVDAATGDVLFEDQADVQGYPASVIKLMDLLIVLEKIEEGALKLDDPITISAEVSKIGGSQVYLKEKEVFPVEDLLYAMMVQSANDAATALATYVGGTKDGFVELMNEKAKALGMSNTELHSVHGLPPGPGQEPDVTTARDLALLCRELLKRPDTLKYTSTMERGFRDDTFVMRNHNPLLRTVDGCDGLKTGYFSKAGYAVAATAQRKGDRVIVVILGSPDKNIRGEKAAELLAKGFLEIGKRKAEREKTAGAPPSTPNAQR